MTEQFDIHERLYRAVYPPEIMPMFWKENGEISSAVFRILFDNTSYVNSGFHMVRIYMYYFLRGII